jgi:hypothetical protein
VIDYVTRLLDAGLGDAETQGVIKANPLKSGDAKPPVYRSKSPRTAGLPG